MIWRERVEGEDSDLVSPGVNKETLSECSLSMNIFLEILLLPESDSFDTCNLPLVDVDTDFCIDFSSDAALTTNLIIA